MNLESHSFLNVYHSLTHCEFANSVVPNYIYNDYGLLTHIQTGNKITTFYGGGYERNRIDELKPVGFDVLESIEIGGLEPAYRVDSAFLNYRYAYDTSNTTQTWYYEIENAHGGQCRQAMRTRWCGGISADLIFLLLF